MFQGMIT